MRLANIYAKATKYRSIIVLTLCILTLLYFSLSVFGSSSGGVFWKYDDAEHLSVATNFIHGKGFTISYMPGADQIPLQYAIKELEIYPQINNPLQEKGPIYMILLGAWLGLTSAAPADWILLGTIFNILLSICLLCLYYYWVKKSFGFWVSTFSTLLLASLSFIFWPAARIIADPLVGIFLVSAFYFAKSEMGKRNVVILGVLVGLGQLTHGIGIMMGVTILLFLLIERKVQNAVLFTSIWVIVLLPWMIRNTLLFGNPVLGLAIPFPSSWMRVIDSFIKPPFGAIAGGWQVAFGVGPSSHLISPIKILSEFFSEVNSVYGMELVTILIFGLALIGFAVWVILFKRNRTHKLHINDASNAQELKVRNEVYLRTIIFCGVAFAAYYSLATLSGGIAPESRFLLPILYFLIPISFAGIETILHLIPEKKIVMSIPRVSRKARKGVNLRLLVLVILLLLFISLIGPAVLSSVAIVNGDMQFTLETPDQKILNSWIRSNIPSDAKIACTEPTGLYLRTGLAIIPLKQPLFDSNTTYLQWLNEKFSIDYLVLYNYNSDALSLYLGNNTSLFQIYAVGENEVYQYFNGLPYSELNPTIITDGNTTDLSLVQFRSGSYNWSLSQETAETVNGSLSAKITQSPGNQSSFAVDRTFAAEQDWATKTDFCIWIYGNNSGGTLRFSVAAPNWSNYFWYTSEDDYAGWRLIVVPLQNFEIAAGTPNWSTVKTVRILDGATGSLYYVGRGTVDSGIIANNDEK